MTDAPQRLAVQLDRIQAQYGTTAQARLDAMPDRTVFEDRPYVDPETRRAERWAQAIPNRFRWATLADLSTQTAQIIQLWADSGPTTNLILAGPVGVGKSHAACAAGRVLHDRHLEVEFWPVVNLLDGLRPGSDVCTTLYGRLTDDADLLILDDLGRQKATEWADERLYAIVNQRWLDEKPTVVTTTYKRVELTEHVGEHMTSRLCGGATVIGLDGVDRRSAP